MGLFQIKTTGVGGGGGGGYTFSPEDPSGIFGFVTLPLEILEKTLIFDTWSINFKFLHPKEHRTTCSCSRM